MEITVCKLIANLCPSESDSTCPKASSVIESLRSWPYSPMKLRIRRASRMCARPCNWILDCFLFELHSGHRVPHVCTWTGTHAHTDLNRRREGILCEWNVENCRASPERRVFTSKRSPSHIASRFRNFRNFRYSLPLIAIFHIISINLLAN